MRDTAQRSTTRAVRSKGRVWHDETLVDDAGE
jgi:hypothetical protein